MSQILLLFGYSTLIILASLAGGLIPLLVRLTHTRMQLAMSFVGGAMLGVGLLHLLPHAFFEWQAIYPTVWWLLGGFLFMFFVERVFHSHHHDVPADVAPPESGCMHEHDAAERRHHGGAAADRRPLNWAAALVGLSLHSGLDGVALAASVSTEIQQTTGGWLAGLTVFLVIFLHKPFDSMTLGGLMAVAGRSPRVRHLVNGVYALSAPAGMLLFYAGQATASGDHHRLVGSALAFAAGTFLCISTSDLLPELQFHAHDRLKLSAALLLGLSLSAALVLLEESGHQHDRPSAPAGVTRPHSHAGGDGHAH